MFGSIFPPPICWTLVTLVNVVSTGFLCGSTAVTREMAKSDVVKVEELVLITPRFLVFDTQLSFGENGVTTSETLIQFQFTDKAK